MTPYYGVRVSYWSLGGQRESREIWSLGICVFAQFLRGPGASACSPEPAFSVEADHPLSHPYSITDRPNFQVALWQTVAFQATLI